MTLLDGEHAPFRTAEQRRALIGCAIRYLRDVDIDRSGRGYFFPRTDLVADAQGKQLIFENGNSVSVSELREVVIAARPTPEGEGR